MTDDDKNLVFIPVEQAIVPPPGLIEHHKDCWWIVHPTKGIVFWRKSAQCNPYPVIADKIKHSLYPWAEVRFFPSVFNRINPHDY